MKVTILDCETTGLTENRTLPLAKQPSVIEFAAALIDLGTGEYLDGLDLLIKPPIPVTAEITKITGLKNEDLETAPPFAAVADQIFAFIEASPAVVAHNLSFDAEMLDIEAERLGRIIKWPRKICTVESTVHLTGIRLSLSALYSHLFNEEFKGAHRARVDVAALTRCCVELFKQGEL